MVEIPVIVVWFLTIVFDGLLVAATLCMAGWSHYKERRPQFAELLRILSMLTGAALLVLMTLMALVTGG